MRRWAAIAIGAAMSACLLLGTANAQNGEGCGRNPSSGGPLCGSSSKPPAPPLPPTPGGGHGTCKGQQAQNCASCMQKCAFNPTRAAGSCNKGECDVGGPNYSNATRSDVYLNCAALCSPDADLQGPPSVNPLDGSISSPPRKDCICPISPNPSKSPPSFFLVGKSSG